MMGPISRTIPSQLQSPSILVVSQAPVERASLSLCAQLVHICFVWRICSHALDTPLIYLMRCEKQLASVAGKRIPIGLLLGTRTSEGTEGNEQST